MAKTRDDYTAANRAAWDASASYHEEGAGFASLLAGFARPGFSCLDDILTETTRGVTVGIEGLGLETIDQLRAEYPGLLSSGRQVTFEVGDLERAKALVHKLTRAEENARVSRFEPHRDDLETIFVRSLSTESAA